MNLSKSHLLLMSWMLLLAASTLRADENPTVIDFERDVVPILARRCLPCHNARDAEGGLALARRDTALAGGDSGRVIVPGKLESSLLWQRVRDGEMPPEQQGRAQPLPHAEVEMLGRWIQQGAQWPAGRIIDLYEVTSDERGGRDWWSLQPLQLPDVPAVRSQDDASNAVDAFILDRLHHEQMIAAPPADRRTLIRRLYTDVLGIPPTLEQIEAYQRDESPDAWTRLVDRVLASPRYGERWGRHWLDVVRFAETSGYERDQTKPNAWKYRDWVVEALNADMPYDRFIIEQLAGDEMPDRSENTVIATGFLRLGTWNDEPNDPQDYKYERLEDLVHATSSAFLGLTVKCARCHDHKFDPIPQEDYYAMAAVFWAGPIEPRDRELLGGPTVEELGVADVLGWTDVTSSPAPLQLLKAGDRAHPLREVAPAPLSLLPSLRRSFALAGEGDKTSRRRIQLARWIADPRNPLTSRVIVNRLWQLHFGQGLVRSPNNFGFTGELPTHPQLLDWLASDLVRHGWQLKRTHRLLLLSSTYRQSSVHPRQVEYHQRDAGIRWWWRAQRRRLDAESLRDWQLAVSGQLDLQLGGPSFRPTISAEALEGLSRKGEAWVASPPEQQRRRSLYIFTQRSLLVPMMTTFDFQDTTLPCGQRDVTTVAPQALVLMNNQFVHQCSEALARRVTRLAGDDVTRQVIAAWTIALGRRPSQDEIQLATSHIAAQQQRFAESIRLVQSSDSTADQRPATPHHLALTSLCHVLLTCNEFLHVD